MLGFPNAPSVKRVGRISPGWLPLNAGAHQELSLTKAAELSFGFLDASMEKPDSAPDPPPVQSCWVPFRVSPYADDGQGSGRLRCNLGKGAIVPGLLC